MWAVTEYEAFLRAEAERRGIDPGVAVVVANSEGGLTEPARRGTFPTGSSWWAFQLHYGGKGYEHFGTTAGMGNSFTAATGWQPGDPKAWRDAMRYALDRAKSGGWGPWYGAAARGITGFYGINTTRQWAGTPADEWDFRSMGGPAPPPTPAPVPPASNLDAVLARVVELGKAETGKRYAGPVIGEPDSYRWGDPGWDCSSFGSAMYSRATNGAIKLTPFTDAAHDQCEWLATPKPGALVFYFYRDPSQPGVKIPHMGIWLSPTEVLDARYPDGVGIHPHVTPVDDGRGRYRRTMLPKGLANVVVATPPTPPADPTAALRERISGLETALAHVCDVVVPKAAELQREAASIREQYLGARP